MQRLTTVQSLPRKVASCGVEHKILAVQGHDAALEQALPLVFCVRDLCREAGTTRCSASERGTQRTGAQPRSVPCRTVTRRGSSCRGLSRHQLHADAQSRGVELGLATHGNKRTAVVVAIAALVRGPWRWCANWRSCSRQVSTQGCASATQAAAAGCTCGRSCCTRREET